MPSSTPDAAADVWARMQVFVERNAPRTKLREQLGSVLGTGRGKVKALLMLAAGPMSLGEIAGALAIDRPYATVIVNSLEQAGLVERTGDPSDRRRKLVELTAAGQTAVSSAREVIETPPSALRRLEPAEIAQLGTILARLAQPEK